MDVIDFGMVVLALFLAVVIVTGFCGVMVLLDTMDPWIQRMRRRVIRRLIGKWTAELGLSVCRADEGAAPVARPERPMSVEEFLAVINRG